MFIVQCFKYRHFASWAKSERITDNELKNVLSEINAGLVDADLGNGLLKKRVAKKGQGKRGGYRMLLAFKQGYRTFFIYGFAKNQRDNITNKERQIYRKLAEIYLGLDDGEIEKLVRSGEIIRMK